MEPRDTRDLPEVVAEILIEQHAMREEIAAMRQEMREGNAALRQEISEGNAALRQEISEGNVALRQEISESNIGLGNTLREELRASHEGMAQLFNDMTNAILDAMNRGNDRYERTGQEIDSLKTRVTKLENPAAGTA